MSWFLKRLVYNPWRLYKVMSCGFLKPLLFTNVQLVPLHRVGSVCGIVSSMDMKQTEFFNLMDSLNAFIKDARMPMDLASR